MLIMTLSLAQKGGGITLIKNYFSLLDQWTQYLIEDSLVPAEQLSTDDFAGQLANQTNLAIKGIIGVKAMAEISRALGEDTDAQQYDVCCILVSLHHLCVPLTPTGYDPGSCERSCQLVADARAVVGPETFARCVRQPANLGYVVQHVRGQASGNQPYSEGYICHA